MWRIPLKMISTSAGAWNSRDKSWKNVLYRIFVVYFSWMCHCFSKNITEQCRRTNVLNLRILLIWWIYPNNFLPHFILSQKKNKHSKNHKLTKVVLRSKGKYCLQLIHELVSKRPIEKLHQLCFNGEQSNLLANNGTFNACKMYAIEWVHPNECVRLCCWVF